MDMISLCLRHTLISTQCCSLEFTGACTQSIRVCRSGHFAADSVCHRLLRPTVVLSRLWGNTGKCWWMGGCVRVSETERERKQDWIWMVRVTVRTCMPNEVIQLSANLYIKSLFLSFYWENGNLAEQPQKIRSLLIKNMQICPHVVVLLISCSQCAVTASYTSKKKWM